MAIALKPVTLTPGVSSNVPLNNLGSILAIKLTNGTPFDITVSGFGFNGSGIVPAGTEYMLHAEVENSGVISLYPVNNVGASGTGIANLTVFVIGEKLPPGNWPVTVPAQTVSAKVSTVTDLINDGNISGHQFLESTVSGAPGSTWSFTNDGNASFIGVLVANIVDKLIQISNVDPLLAIGIAGHLTEVLGSLTIDQVLTITGNMIANGGMNINTIRDNVAGNVQVTLAAAGITIANILTLTSNLNLNGGSIFDSQGNGVIAVTDTGGVTQNTRLQSTSVINFQVPGGTSIAHIDSTGFHLDAGAVAFLSGSFAHVQRFTGTGNGTVATGVTNPFSIVNDACTVSGSSQTIGMTIASSSVVTTGAALAWHGTAYN